MKHRFSFNTVNCKRNFQKRGAVEPELGGQAIQFVIKVGQWI